MNETRGAGGQGVGCVERQSGTRPTQPFSTFTRGFCGSSSVLCRGEIAHKRENTSGEPCCGGRLEGKTPGLTRNITRSDTQEIGHQQVGKRAESRPSRSLYAGSVWKSIKWRKKGRLARTVMGQANAGQRRSCGGI